MKFLLRLLFVLMLPLTGHAADQPGAPLPVFVSIEPLRYLVEQVGGERVTVKSLIAPGDNPATFSPSPREMAALQRARLFVSIGVPSERGWLPRLRASQPDLLFIDGRKGITLHRLPGHSHGNEDSDDEDLDPHVWTDPLAARQIAANVRDALIRLDPAHRRDYEQGFERLAGRLETLDRRIRERLATLSPRRFLVFHPSWGYFGRRYGLEQIAIEHAGKSPGIRRLARLIERMKKEGLRKIIVQPQFSRRDAETIAAETGATVVAVDPLAYDLPATLLEMARALSGPTP